MDNARSLLTRRKRAVSLRSPGRARLGAKREASFIDEDNFRASARIPFFNTGPIMRQLCLDQGVIMLPSIDRRVLRTPAKRFKAVRQIMGMVLDPEFDENDGANAAKRPTIRAQASLQCASTQHPQQQLPLLWGEAGRTPRHAALFQTTQIPLTLAQLLSPAADSGATDACLARNSRVREGASLQLPTGF